LIGGFPMPPWSAVAKGLKKLGKLAWKGLKKLKKKKVNNKCDNPGEPIDPVNGANVDVCVDYEVAEPVPFRWVRSYSSAERGRDGPMGRGFRHSLERSLSVDLDMFVYTDAEGQEVEFPALRPGRTEVVRDGYTLRLLRSGPPAFYELSRG